MASKVWYETWKDGKVTRINPACILEYRVWNFYMMSSIYNLQRRVAYYLQNSVVYFFKGSLVYFMQSSVIYFSQDV